MKQIIWIHSDLHWVTCIGWNSIGFFDESPNLSWVIVLNRLTLYMNKNIYQLEIFMDTYLLLQQWIKTVAMGEIFPNLSCYASQNLNWTKKLRCQWFILTISQFTITQHTLFREFEDDLGTTVQLVQNAMVKIKPTWLGNQKRMLYVQTLIFFHLNPLCKYSLDINLCLGSWNINYHLSIKHIWKICFKLNLENITFQKLNKGITIKLLCNLNPMLFFG